MTEQPCHRLLRQVGEGFVLTALPVRPELAERARSGRADRAVIRLYGENGSVWQSAPVSSAAQAQEKGFGWFVAPETGTQGMTISFLNETSRPVTIQRATIELFTTDEPGRDEIKLPLFPFTLNQNIGLTFVWQRPLVEEASQPEPDQQQSDTDTDTDVGLGPDPGPGPG